MSVKKNASTGLSPNHARTDAGNHGQNHSQNHDGFRAWSSRSPRGSARQAFAAVTVAAVSVLLQRSSSAQSTLTWEPNPPTVGGNGTWNLTTPNWNNGSANVTYDGVSNTVFDGPAGNYTVTVNGPISVGGNLFFNNTSNGAGTIYNIVAPSIGGGNYSSQSLTLTGSTPTITVNGANYNAALYGNTAYNASNNAATGAISTGYALIGSSNANTTTTSVPAGGVYLNGSNGFTVTGGGELILANPILATGTITVNDGSTLTVGNRAYPYASGYSNYPYTFLNNDAVVLNSAQLQLATTATLTGTGSSATATLQIGPITVSGPSSIDLFRVSATASSSVQFYHSALTLVSGSNAATAANLNFYETGTTQGSGAYMQFPSTTVQVPAGDTPSNDYVTINATEGAGGLKIESPTLGSYTDNGVTTNFLGGGTFNTASGQIEIQTSGGSVSSSSGNWVIGSSAGGVDLEVLTTAGGVGFITSGASVTVNPYSQLFLSGQGFLTWGSSGQTITLNGVGATTYNSTTGAVSGEDPGALSFSSTTTSATGTSNYLESNVVLESTTTSNLITVASNTTSQIDGNITQNASTGTYSLTKYGAGTLILNGTANAWTGGTNISQGTIYVSSNSSLGTYDANIKGSLTLASIGTSNTALTLNNAIQTVGSLSSSFAAVSGTVTNTITLNKSNTVLNVVQTTPGTFGPGAVSTLSSTITGPGSLQLDPRSTATLTLSGPNNYSGGTVVNGGGLVVSNTTGSATGSGPVFVSNATFGGNGTVTGAVNASNASLIFGSTIGSSGHLPGTLTLSGGLNVSGGSATYYLNTPNSSDLLSLGSSTLNLTGSTTVYLDNLGSLSTNKYQLASFSDGSAPSVAGLSVGAGAPSGFTYNFSSTPTGLYLNVTSPTSVTWALSGNGAWDTTSPNWNNGSGLTNFTNGLAALFDDTSGGTNSVVTLTSALSPSLVTFANNTKSYNISGSGSIAGNTALLLSGTGIVTLATTSGNTFTGNVAIDGGAELIATSDAQLGNALNAIVLTSAVGSANTSTFEFNNPSNTTSGRLVTLFGAGGAIDVPANQITTLTGPVLGSGGLTKIDAGTLVLTNASNGFVGVTNISGGTLQVGATGAIPAASSLIVGPGTSFVEGGFSTTVSSLSGSGSILFNKSGTALTAGSNNMNSSFSGPITGAGEFAWAGSGTLNLTNSTSNFSGGLVVSNGGTVIGGSSINSLGTGNLNVSGGATIVLGAPLISGTQSLFVGTGGGAINTSGSALTGGTGTVNFKASALTGGATTSSTLTVYGGYTNISIGTTTSTANQTSGIIVGKIGDGGGNTLILNNGDTLGNTGLGADVGNSSTTAPTYFITIASQYNASLGSASQPGNTLLIGNTGTTGATPTTGTLEVSGQAGVQMGYNTTASALTTYTLNGVTYKLGNPDTGEPQIGYAASSSSTNPYIQFQNGSVWVGKGFSGYSGGEDLIVDGASVTFNVPLATDVLIDSTAVRGQGTSSAVNTQINVTGQGTWALTSGAVSATGTSQYQGSWNVAMGYNGSVGTGVPYSATSNTSTGALLVAPITGSVGEPLTALGFATGAPTGVGTTINLYSGVFAMGADQADPVSTTVLSINSFRNTINFSGGAIASSGYDYLANFNHSYGYAIVGNASNGTYVSANFAGNMTIMPNSVGTVLTYDPLNPGTGSRNLNFTTNGTSVPGNITWDTNSTLMISAGNTSGGAVSFGRTLGAIVVDSGATLNISSGSIVNIGFVPGLTGTGTSGTASAVLSGIDPLTGTNYPLSVNVVDNGGIVWGGRTGLNNSTGTSDTGFKEYAVGNLTIGSTGTATLNAAATGVVNPNLSQTVLTVTGTLTIQSGGKLDIGSNVLIVEDVGTTGLAQITSMVKASYNRGNWNTTTGLVSSAAAADSRHLTGIGVILNDDGTGTGNPLYGSGFEGSNEPNTSNNVDTDVLVKYTYYGDTNLDGAVDGSDYSRIDSAYQSENFSGGLTTSPVSGWFNGDFNYDGVVDGSDYTLMDNAFNAQGISFGTNPAAVVSAQIDGGSSVPEPATLSLLILGAVGILGRRRRRSAIGAAS
jgi:autotransporter-associated beta strand protein